jgi:hypothetical protein
VHVAVVLSSKLVETGKAGVSHSVRHFMHEWLPHQNSQENNFVCVLRCLLAVLSDANFFLLQGSGINSRSDSEVTSNDLPCHTFEHFRRPKVLMVNMEAGVVLPPEELIATIWPKTLVSPLLCHLADL